MLNIFSAFLDANKRTLNEYSKIVSQINALEAKTKKLKPWAIYFFAWLPVKTANVHN